MADKIEMADKIKMADRIKMATKHEFFIAQSNGLDEN
jgi:hypothetical protein